MWNTFKGSWNLYQMPYTKVKSQQINSLNIWAEIIKMLEENIVVNLNDLGFGIEYLDIISKSWETKEKIGDFDLIKS